MQVGRSLHCKKWLTLPLGLAESVIRCLPGQDKTNGFFVACFVRKASIGTKRPQDFEQDQDHEEADGDEAAEADEEDQAVGIDLAVLKPARMKTVAQLERTKRKKQTQRKRRKLDPV